MGVCYVVEMNSEETNKAENSAVMFMKVFIFDTYKYTSKGLYEEDQ